MYIFSIILEYIHLVKEIEVAGVPKNLTLAIIVLQKITRVIVVADDQNININLRNPKNILVAIIQTLQTTAPIQIIAVIHEDMVLFFCIQHNINR
jgi:hypothetical protein